MKYITTEEVAKLLGLTARRVRQLSNPDEETGETVFERLPSGDYDAYQVVPAYFAFKEESGPKAEKLAADAEIAKLKARELSRKEAIEERHLYPAAGVRKIWRRLIVEIRNRNLEWLRRKMDRFDMKPMDREQEENEFIEFYNDLAEIEY